MPEISAVTMHNPKKKKSKPRHIRRQRVLRWRLSRLAPSALSHLLAWPAVIGAWYYVQPSLPAAQTIRDIPLQVPLRIFSRDGRLISEVGERRRIPVGYEQVPPHVVNAFVAAEDQRFFEHPGMDYRGILRAVVRTDHQGQ